VRSRDNRNSVTCGSAPLGPSPAPYTANLFIHEPIGYAPQRGGLEADFDAVPAETIARADAHWPTVKLELEGH